MKTGYKVGGGIAALLTIGVLTSNSSFDEQPFTSPDAIKVTVGHPNLSLRYAFATLNNVDCKQITSKQVGDLQLRLAELQQQPTLTMGFKQIGGAVLPLADVGKDQINLSVVAACDGLLIESPILRTIDSSVSMDVGCMVVMNSESADTTTVQCSLTAQGSTTISPDQR